MNDSIPSTKVDSEKKNSIVDAKNSNKSFCFSKTTYHVIKPDFFQEKGLLNYYYKYSNSADNCIELTFTINTSKNCTALDCLNFEQSNLESNSSNVTVETYKVIFKPLFFQNLILDNEIVNETFQLLSFKIQQSFSKKITVCDRKKKILQSLGSTELQGISKNLFFIFKIQELLFYSLECFQDERLENITCKFLENNIDKSKILKARDILLQHLSNPITIKELSKKVAINECYLKKGFKEMFGTTIFEYYQQHRMQHAKYLLCNKGLTVTEVSYLLGYSSISHFSTAFKRFTGIKACELLNPIIDK